MVRIFAERRTGHNPCPASIGHFGQRYGDQVQLGGACMMERTSVLHWPFHRDLDVQSDVVQLVSMIGCVRQRMTVNPAQIQTRLRSGVWFA